MLILWDIDGTLLSSEGAGAQGMELAGQEVFGAAFSLEGIELGGRLDPLIVTDALARMGDIELEPVHATFRATFHGTLPSGKRNASGESFAVDATVSASEVDAACSLFRSGTSFQRNVASGIGRDARCQSDVS